MTKPSKEEQLALRRAAGRNLFERGAMLITLAMMPLWYLPAALWIGMKELGPLRLRHLRAAFREIRGADLRGSAVQAFIAPGTMKPLPKPELLRERSEFWLEGGDDE